MKNFYMKVVLFNMGVFIFIIGSTLALAPFIDVLINLEYIVLLIIISGIQSIFGLIMYAIKDKPEDRELFEEEEETTVVVVPQEIQIVSHSESTFVEEEKSIHATKAITARKRSVVLLISGILGAIYSVYIVAYFTGAIGSSTGAEQVGAAIATTIIMPHMVATVLATIFNIVGWAMNMKWFALVGAILYAVACILFPLYFFFVIIQMILSFVGFGILSKR